MIGSAPLVLAPGQSRQLAFRLSSQGPSLHSISLKITFTARNCHESLLSTVLCHKFRVRSIHSPHKFTFLHPSGTVSYAILRPPSRAISAIRRSRLPILLNLHGAGLEADSDQVRHMLDPVPDLPAWILFPTGVTPWSSDDWRNFFSTQGPWPFKLTAIQTPGVLPTWKQPQQQFQIGSILLVGKDPQWTLIDG